MTENEQGNAALRVARTYGETITKELLSVADGIRTDTYYRPITEDERISFNEKVVQLSGDIEDTQEEKKAQTALYNERIKKASAARRELLKNIKRGSIEVADTIHTFLDHDNYRVYEYNSLGELVATRRMRPEERQLTAFT